MAPPPRTSRSLMDSSRIIREWMCCGPLEWHSGTRAEGGRDERAAPWPADARARAAHAALAHGRAACKARARTLHLLVEGKRARRIRADGAVRKGLLRECRGGEPVVRAGGVPLRMRLVAPHAQACARGGDSVATADANERLGEASSTQSPVTPESPVLSSLVHDRSRHAARCGSPKRRATPHAAPRTVRPERLGPRRAYDGRVIRRDARGVS